MRSIAPTLTQQGIPPAYPATAGNQMEASHDSREEPQRPPARSQVIMPDAIPASAPGAQPQPGASQPGQPAAKQAPFGSSPATGPTPNRGYEAAAAQKLGLVLKQLGEMIPMAGATSEMGMAIMDMIKKGSKFVPQGAVTPAAEKNQIDNMAMKNTQNNQQMQAIMAQKAQGGSGQPPGMAT